MYSFHMVRIFQITLSYIPSNLSMCTFFLFKNVLVWQHVALFRTLIHNSEQAFFIPENEKKKKIQHLGNLAKYSWQPGFKGTYFIDSSALLLFIRQQRLSRRLFWHGKNDNWISLYWQSSINYSITVGPMCSVHQTLLIT